MTQTEHYLSAPCAPPDSIPALENTAVAHCCEVWELTRRQARKVGNSVVVSRVAGHKAFQKSLPPLTGPENIQNFIACIAHGMLIGAILGIEMRPQDGPEAPPATRFRSERFRSPKPALLDHLHLRDGANIYSIFSSLRRIT
jgi:hypothetical protein